MSWDLIKCLPILLLSMNCSHGTAGRQCLYFYMDMLTCLVSSLCFALFNFRSYFTIGISALLHSSDSCKIFSVRVYYRMAILLFLNVEVYNYPAIELALLYS